MPSFLRSFWTAVFKNLSSDIFRKYNQLIFIHANFGKIFKDVTFWRLVGIGNAVYLRTYGSDGVGCILGLLQHDVTGVLCGMLQKSLWQGWQMCRFVTSGWCEECGFDEGIYYIKCYWCVTKMALMGLRCGLFGYILSGKCFVRWWTICSKVVGRSRLVGFNILLISCLRDMVVLITCAVYNV